MKKLNLQEAHGPFNKRKALPLYYLSPNQTKLQGAQPRVRFNPPMLEMGPVLPHAPQGDLREVTVLNEGTWDVEIFSLDFDKVEIVQI